MEFKFNVNKVLRPDVIGMAVLQGERGNPFRGGQAASQQRNSSYFGGGFGPQSGSAVLSEAD